MEIETLTWDYLGWKNNKHFKMSEQEAEDFNSSELKGAGATWEDGSTVTEEEIDELVKDMGFENMLEEIDISPQDDWNETLSTLFNKSISLLGKFVCDYTKKIPSAEDCKILLSDIVIQVHSEKILNFINYYDRFKTTSDLTITPFGGHAILNIGKMHESVIKIFFVATPENYVALELQNLH